MGYRSSSEELIFNAFAGAVMLRISRLVSIAVLVLETALVGTVARAQSPTWLSDQRFSWAPGGGYNWSGFYVGINGGGAWSPDRNIIANETFNNDPFFEGAFGSRSVQGGFGGAQFGYGSLHLNHWYFGGEFDVQGGSISGKSREIFTPYLSAGNSITFRTNECMDFISTLRGRVGYAFDQTLIYATGGGAVVNTNLRINMMDTFGFDAAATSKGLRGGYAVGAGVEQAFKGNWSVKAEYLYINVGNAFVGAREFLGATPSSFNISATNRIDYSTFKVGLNYKFGGTALRSLTGN
jgi:outer membrane immunogenic protein